MLSSFNLVYSYIPSERSWECKLKTSWSKRTIKLRKSECGITVLFSCILTTNNNIESAEIRGKAKKCLLHEN